MYRQKHVALPTLAACASDVPSASLMRSSAPCKNREERWQSIGDFLAAVEPARAIGLESEVASRQADGFPSAEWTTRHAWDAEDVHSAAPADPTAVPTVAMAARHEAQRPSGVAMRGRNLRLSHSAESRAREAARNAADSACDGSPRRAAPGSSPQAWPQQWAVVTGSCAGPRRGDDAAMDTPAQASADSVTDRHRRNARCCSGPCVARARHARGISTIARPLPALATPAWHVTEARAHAAPRASEPGPSPYDPVRARAATATLSLQAYQAAVAGAALLQAPAAVAPLQVGNDTNTPATGVRVAPHRAAPSNAATGSPIQDSSSPAVGVRVHTPPLRTP